MTFTVDSSIVNAAFGVLCVVFPCIVMFLIAKTPEADFQKKDNILLKISGFSGLLFIIGTLMYFMLLRS